MSDIMICENAGKCEYNECARKKPHRRTSACFPGCQYGPGIPGSRCVPCDDNGKPVKTTEQPAATPSGFLDGEIRDRLIISGFGAMMRIAGLAINDTDLSFVVRMADAMMEARRDGGK